MDDGNYLQTQIFKTLSGVNDTSSQQFLLDYIDNIEGWQPLYNILLSSNSIEIKYFASNMLYSKLKKHWSQLDENNRKQLFDHLLRILEELVMLNSNKVSPVTYLHLILTHFIHSKNQFICTFFFIFFFIFFSLFFHFYLYFNF